MLLFRKAIQYIWEMVLNILIKRRWWVMANLGILKGQGLVEYALILTFVAVVVVIILAFFGPTISDVFSNIIAGL